MISVNKLAQLGFVETHGLERTASESLRFRALPAVVNEPAPSVYAWVARPAAQGTEAVHVLYVGKAGRGIDARLHQHEGGFTHSGTGRSNATLLQETIRRGDRVSVFTRRSAVIELFGVTVSLYSAEEDALARVLKPSFNRADFPDV